MRLLLISRDGILSVMNDEAAERAFRLLAGLTRNGFHLLATAPQPDKWLGEHGSPDDALLGPNSIRKRLTDAGGTLDGVYYVRLSMLTQKRNREDALKDMLQRYSAKPEETVLLSSVKKFARAAGEMGIRATLLGRERKLIDELEKLSEETATKAEN